MVFSLAILWMIYIGAKIRKVSDILKIYAFNAKKKEKVIEC